MEFSPKKCCIKYDPPTLVLFYEVKSSGKLHRRSIPIRSNSSSNNEKILDNLLKESHHSKYLKEYKREQLQRLIKMLLEKESGLKIDLTEKKAPVDIEATDLNRLDDEKLNLVKDIMNESFENNQVKPGDVGWKYDVETEFDRNNGKIESSGWDEGDESDMEF